MTARHLVLAAAVAGAFMLPAPPAGAGHHEFGCGFRAVQQDDVTGPYFEGVAYGYVAGDADDLVTVSCAVVVNGETVATTAAGAGTAVAHSWGRVSYAAGDTDVVELCAAVTVNGVPDGRCHEARAIYSPPQTPYDYFPYFLDSAACPVLAGRAGTYGPVFVNSQGDVYVAGEPQWDCPPYDIWPPA